MGLNKLDPKLKQKAIDELNKGKCPFSVAQDLDLMLPTVRNWYNKIQQLKEDKIKEEFDYNKFENSKEIPSLPFGIKLS